MHILIIHGPNLNMLGLRDVSHYGSITLVEINQMLEKYAQKLNVSIDFFQSNHEGAIIDFLQKASSRSASGILINPSALTHYSYSLRDALFDTKLPIVEVHLSDINNREEFRKINVLDGIVIKKITGLKEQSYIKGLKILVEHIQNKTK